MNPRMPNRAAIRALSAGINCGTVRSRLAILAYAGQRSFNCFWAAPQSWPRKSTVRATAVAIVWARTTSRSADRLVMRSSGTYKAAARITSTAKPNSKRHFQASEMFVQRGDRMPATVYPNPCRAVSGSATRWVLCYDPNCGSQEALPKRHRG